MKPYEPLARKHRPQSFEELVGQEALVRALRNALASQKIHPAYIFSGIRGIGKTTVARIFAKGLNCEKGITPNPCNKCSSCEEITRSFSIDMLEIDGATHTGAEETRILADMAKYTPSRDRFRIFLIDEVHMLSKAAFNALLKTLEEPPPQAVFLFATTEPHKIPETIESRSHHFRLKRITEEQILGHLESVVKKEGISIEPSAIRVVARFGEGSMRDSLTILDRLISYAGLESITEEMASKALGIVGREFLLKSARAIILCDLKSLYSLLDELFERGDDPERFLLDLMRFFREVLKAKTLGGADEEITLLAAKASMEDVLRTLDLFVAAVQKLKQALDQRVVLELELTKAANLPHILPMDKIVKIAQNINLGRGEGLLPLDSPLQGSEEKDESIKENAPYNEMAREEPLRFSALIPFKRMDEEETKSLDLSDSRIENFKKEVSLEIPLGADTLERSALSVDPAGNLHIAVPRKNSSVLDYLKKAENMKKLQELANKQDIKGSVFLEKGNGEETEDSSLITEEEPAPKQKLTKGTMNLVETFEGQVVKVSKKEPVAETGGEDAELE